MRLVSTALVLMTATAAADVELQNDGFMSGGTAGFQGGFVSGEAGASRFHAPDAGRQVFKVHLLFGGGSTASEMVTLKVWDDSAMTDAPGAELESADFMLTGSDVAMQELDITVDNVIVPQVFRVGIVFSHDGAPSIARDADGTISAADNYIMASGLGWKKSQTLGLTGDWIIRAVVSGVGGGGTDAGTTGGSCNGNGDCAVGSYCDLTSHSCTFDCRTNTDCQAGTCNSLGMCIDSGKGGGCCRTDRGGGGATVLALGVLLAIRRRRR
jgi:hypothetical protein